MGLTVRVDGIDSALAGRLLQSLSVVDEEEDSADSCELALAVGDLPVAIPRKGAKMEFFAADGRRVGGAYAVNRVSGSNRGGVMKIRGAEYDIRNDLRSARSASFTGNTLGQIAAAIGARYGMPASVADSLRTSVPAGAVQVAESDLAFLKRVANASGAKFSVKGGRLLISAQGEPKSASGRPLPAVALDALDPHVSLSWEVSDRETRRVCARFFAPDGATLKAAAFGEGEITEMLPDVYPDRNEAEKAASKAAAKLEPNGQSLSGETGLRLDFAAGYPLSVSGLPRGVSARWKILSVSHFFRPQAPTKPRLRPLY